jgi:hypothetical protein
MLHVAKPNKHTHLSILWQYIYITFLNFIFSGSAAQRRLWPPRPQGFLITHDIPQSVGLLWMSDQLITDIYIYSVLLSPVFFFVLMFHFLIVTNNATHLYSRRFLIGPPVQAQLSHQTIRNTSNQTGCDPSVICIQ